MAATLEAIPTLEGARLIALRLIEEPFVERVLLFGSVARGDARPDSDLDVVVLLHDAASEDYAAASRRMLAAAAQTAEDMGVAGRLDHIVCRLTGDWEHAVANVPSSFEAAVFAEAVELAAAPSSGPARERPPTIMANVPDNNADAAASHLRGVSNSLDRLKLVLLSARGSATSDPQGRHLTVLSDSHLVIEQSAKSVVAAAGGRSVRTHDIDDRIDAIASRDARGGLQDAVAALRDPGGHLTNWRSGIYNFDDNLMLEQMTAENAADHLRAAVKSAALAADFLDERSSASAHRDTTAAVRAHIAEIENMGISPAMFSPPE